MLRVLTLNIWNLGGDWRARRQAILSVIRSCEADVVCLQEVVEAGGKNQARWLARELGDWSCTYGGEPGYGLDDFVFGNAVLARWPATDTAVGRLPHEPHEREVQRLAVHARVDGVDVFSTHLAWQLHDAALRERQVLALMEFVEARTDPDAGIGPVVAGDFNAEPDASCIRYLCGLQPLGGTSTYLQDAWRVAGDGGPGLTWMNHNPHAALDAEPERRLDYVFSGFHGRSGSGRPLECRVVADEPVDGVWPTDHFGVLAVLAR